MYRKTTSDYQTVEYKVQCGRTIEKSVMRRWSITVVIHRLLVLYVNVIQNCVRCCCKNLFIECIIKVTVWLS